jgi:hypothetical protein
MTWMDFGPAKGILLFWLSKDDSQAAKRRTQARNNEALFIARLRNPPLWVFTVFVNITNIPYYNMTDSTKLLLPASFRIVPNSVQDPVLNHGPHERSF